MSGRTGVGKDSIETAYCFFHQKWRVYERSGMDWQREGIEYAIAQYAESMDAELYQHLACGREDFLVSHAHFAGDMQQALCLLEELLES